MYHMQQILMWGGAVRRMVEFIAGLFIGAVAGVAVMSLCAAAKERDEL